MTAKMTAVVYHGPNDLRIEEVAQPLPGPGELLLRVEAASICGTDLRIYHGAHRKYPPGTVRIPGHEMVGSIVAWGVGARGYTEGQRVFVAPNWGCGHCRQCISGNNNRCAEYGAIGISVDGAFAEYLRVPAPAVLQGCVMPVGAGVDAAEAALIEPFACVLRGQAPLQIRPGDRVLVIGAGPIGQMHMLLARLSGARMVLVSDLSPVRRELAKQAGADRVNDLRGEDLETLVQEITDGDGMEVVIVAAPAHAAMEQAVRLAGIGGRINFFGGLPKDRPVIQMDANLIHYKELLVTGTTACSTADCRRSAEILSSGKIDLSSLVSQRFPLELALEAFAAAENQSSLKIVLEPRGG
jgi:L-iditol 2-dehydrogenase